MSFEIYIAGHHLKPYDLYIAFAHNDVIALPWQQRRRIKSGGPILSLIADFQLDFVGLDLVASKMTSQRLEWYRLSRVESVARSLSYN